MLQILLFINCISYVIYTNLIATENSFSNLKEINPEYSLKGLILKLKLQCFGHLMQSSNSLKKTLMLAKIENKRRKGQQRRRWLDSIKDSMNMKLSEFKLWEIVKDKGAWHAAVHGVTK